MPAAPAAALVLTDEVRPGRPPAHQPRAHHRRDPEAPTRVAGCDPLVEPPACREARRQPPIHTHFTPDIRIIAGLVEVWFGIIQPQTKS